MNTPLIENPIPEFLRETFRKGGLAWAKRPDGVYMPISKDLYAAMYECQGCKVLKP